MKDSRKLDAETVLAIRNEMVAGREDDPTPERCGALYAWAAVLLFHAEATLGLPSAPLREDDHAAQ